MCAFWALPNFSKLGISLDTTIISSFLTDFWVVLASCRSNHQKPSFAKTSLEVIFSFETVHYFLVLCAVPTNVVYCWVPLKNLKCLAVLCVHCGTLGNLSTHFGNHRLWEPTCFFKQQASLVVLESLVRWTEAIWFGQKKRICILATTQWSDISRGSDSLHVQVLEASLQKEAPKENQ